MAPKYNIKETLKKNFFFPRRKKDSLVDFMLMKEQEVLDKFATFPNAMHIKGNTADEQYVFVPGAREDKILLIAHADTVFNDADIEIAFSNGILFSPNEQKGIGADDRAGCFILNKLKDLGHSLLITNGEESGCIGSRFLTKNKEHLNLVNNHNFAIQFDRRGDRDIVTYSVGSPKMISFLESKYKTKEISYKLAQGSSTDIRVLFDQDNYPDDDRDKIIAAANLSAGYYGEHGSDELLCIADLQRTLNLTFRMLSEKKLPKFFQDKKPKYNYPSHHGNHGNGYGYMNNHGLGHTYGYSSEYETEDYGIPTTRPNYETSIKMEDFILCPICDTLLDTGEIDNNSGKCVSCNSFITKVTK